VATARPGWSRRAQYSLFFSFLALIAGILVGLFLLALSLVAPARFESVRGAALDVTGPVASALHEVTATVGGLFTGAGNYWDAANQNAKLKRERDAMRRQILQARAIVQENRQLKATLKLQESTQDAVAVGRVVGSSFNSPRRFAILSVGSRAGVHIGMPQEFVQPAGALPAEPDEAYLNAVARGHRVPWPGSRHAESCRSKPRLRRLTGELSCGI